MLVFNSWLFLHIFHLFFLCWTAWPCCFLFPQAVLMPQFSSRSPATETSVINYRFWYFCHICNDIYPQSSVEALIVSIPYLPAALCKSHGEVFKRGEGGIKFILLPSLITVRVLHLDDTVMSIKVSVLSSSTICSLWWQTYCNEALGPTEGK